MNYKGLYLLVDDDMDDSMLFEEVLKDIDSNISFKHATNGAEAIKFLQSLPNSLPLIMFMDLNMPGMDGKECLKEIKNNPNFKDIPVIMYTTSSQQKDMEETMRQGAIGYITKPSSLKDLKTILAAIANNPLKDLKSVLKDLKTPSAFIVVN